MAFAETMAVQCSMTSLRQTTITHRNSCGRARFSAFLLANYYYLLIFCFFFWGEVFPLLFFFFPCENEYPQATIFGSTLLSPEFIRFAISSSIFENNLDFHHYYYYCAFSFLFSFFFF